MIIVTIKPWKDQYLGTTTVSNKEIKVSANHAWQIKEYMTKEIKEISKLNRYNYKIEFVQQ